MSSCGETQKNVIGNSCVYWFAYGSEPVLRNVCGKTVSVEVLWDGTSVPPQTISYRINDKRDRSVERHGNGTIEEIFDAKSGAQRRKSMLERTGAPGQTYSTHGKDVMYPGQTMTVTVLSAGGSYEMDSLQAWLDPN